MVAIPSRRAPLAGVPLSQNTGVAAAAAGALVAGGALVALIFANFLLAMAIPFVVLGAVLCLRFPTPAVIIACLAPPLTGTIMTYLPIVPPKGLADVMLVCLALSVVLAYAMRARDVAIRPFAPLIVIGAYVLMTIGAVLFAEDVGLAFSSFELATLYVLAGMVIACAPWEPATRRRMARGIVIVGLAVAGYSVLRYLVGSTGDEIATARAAQPSLPRSEELRFFGTFLTAQDLAGWCAVMIPFAVGLALAWDGLWRLASACMAALCVLALFASDVRTGAAAAAAGVIVAALVFLACRAFPSGRRIGTGLVALLATLAIGGGGYLVVVANSPGTQERFAGLLDPGDDPNFQVRQDRWEAAWDDVTSEPFGHGLGRTGTVATRGDLLVVGPPILDSSYLKIGIEQGLLVMAIFVAGVMLLLGGLIVRSLRTRDPSVAALGIAASGVLTALIVLYYGSTYIESPSVATPAWIVIGLAIAGFTVFVREESSGAAGPSRE